MTKTYSVLATLLSLVLLSGLAHSFYFSIIGGVPVYWWGNEVTMKIGNLRVFSPNRAVDYHGAMIEAINAWNGQSGLRISYTNGNVRGCVRGNNGVSFESNNCGVFFGRSTLAITYSETVRRGIGRLSFANVVFNTNVLWGVHNGGISSPSYDFRRVATHEIGHVIGLGHPDKASPPQSVPTIMHSLYTPTIVQPQPDDINGIRRLYGRARTSLAQGVDSTALSFRSSGNASWFGNSGAYVTLPSDGDAAFSGNITHGQRSCVETTLVHPSILGFEWAVSSEVGRDGLAFYVNNIFRDGVSGTTNPLWRIQVYVIGEPNSQLKWCYEKNGNTSIGLDAGGLNAIAYIPLIPPSNVNASDGISTQRIQITWLLRSGASSYRLYRSTSSGGSYSSIGTSTSNSYTDNSATPGRFYYYRIQSCFGTGESELCSQDSPTTSGYRALTPPSNVNASDGISTQRIQITWLLRSGASSYRLYRSTSSGGSYSSIGTSTSNSYTDNSATPGRFYYYRIQSCFEAGICSQDSPTTSGYRALTPPPNVSASLGRASDIQLSWGSVTGASNYQVLRRASDNSYNLITTATTLSYADTSASVSDSSCQLVYYTVKACSDNANIPCSKNNFIAQGYRNRTSAGSVSSVTDINPKFNAVYKTNAPTNTLVGITICAADNDDVTYSLTDHAGVFRIDSTSGIVSLKVPLSDNGIASTHTIAVKARSNDGSISSQTFTIRVFDAVTITDTNPSTNTIAENVAAGTTVTGITLVARDENDALKIVTWSLTATNTPFAIDSSNGTITLTGSLDYGTIQSYIIIAEVISTENTDITDTLPITIEIEQVIEALRLHIKLFLEGPLQ